jgi:MFS family permease
MVLLAAFLGWMFDGLEMGLFSLTGRPALLELLGPGGKDSIGTWFSVVMAVFLVGAALGGLLFGWLGDRIGRVRAMVWSVLAYSLLSGLCGFVISPGQLVVLRFLASLGMGGEWSLGVALVMEIWPSRWRPMLAGLIGAASNVGFLLIAVLGLALTHMMGSAPRFLGALGLPPHIVQRLLANSGWRLLFMLGALPSLLTLLIRLFVPESQRWKHAAARAPATRIDEIFAPGQARFTLLGTVLAAIALLGTWGSVQWIPAWVDKLAGPAARSQALIALSLGAILACLVAAPAAQWTSRRWAYFVLCLLSLASCAYLFRAKPGYDGGLLLWVFLVGGFSAGFYAWLPLYLPELFPTRIRATGQGFAYNFGRILAAGGTLVSGSLVRHFHEDYAKMGSIITLVYVLGMVVIWFCPETKGRPLPP